MNAQSTDARVDVVFSDVDGTVLNSVGDWRPGARDFIRWLARHGVRVCLCSARPPWSLRDLSADLPISGIAGFGGGVIETRQDSSAWQARHVSCLDSTTVDLVQQLAREMSLEVWLYTDRHWFLSIVDDAALKESAAIRHGWLIGFPGTNDHVRKAMVVGGDGVSSEQQDYLVARLSGRANVASSSPRYLEVMPSGAPRDKGAADLCRLLGTTLRRAAAVGDAMNDVAMLESVAYPFALPPLGNHPTWRDVLVDGEYPFVEITERLHKLGVGSQSGEA